MKGAFLISSKVIICVSLSNSCPKYLKYVELAIESAEEVMNQNADATVSDEVPGAPEEEEDKEET